MGEKVAFIGVGRMGSGMVGRLMAAGHELTLFDPNPAATAPFRDRGAKVAASIDAAAAQDVGPDQVVTALGGGGELVRDPREIGPALDRAFASGRQRNAASRDVRFE